MEKHGILAEIEADFTSRWREGPQSPFVAVGAVLGFEILRRNAKHVVALDADAMQHRGLLGVAGLGFGFGGFLCHTQILT
jgi:hypothetical protein